ncbi:TIGR03621 family F420-dependent LLM class oxidoreductase [Rhodococcus sp. T2V]|uniref:TIGR03621 family F420-dependent LLM class oxidoreductase n=1 Tax=Rhodococcus sp. T2V TaxID=3034164 RepID=UPI0023E12F7E|nr:TIGR03621 family F420-dependent LLM class oxidoreductase [Rhodococcus sp. T2V]MDF3303700.1 TIGR03621 family F420-dependent LLM class oxidoreductase [Rhodococcus sp. T2V]
MPRLRADAGSWRNELRRIEDLGYDTVAVSEHVTDGWVLEPLAAMAFAAASTTRLHVLSLVLTNDLHHPALLAKAAATIDALSDGRLELGIGAGWKQHDYRTVGLPFDPPAERIDRLAEALEIVRQYFSREHVHFTGSHYAVDNMESLPRRSGFGGPPLFVGGGGPRMLELAGRVADIAGIHLRQTTPTLDPAAVLDLTAECVDRKIERVRAAAAAAGRPTPTFQFTCYHVDITDAPSHGPKCRSSFSGHLAEASDMLKDSPAVLTGTVAECAEQLLAWHERYGITYWHLGQDVEAGGAIIAQLSR